MIEEYRVDKEICDHFFSMHNQVGLFNLYSGNVDSKKLEYLLVSNRDYRDVQPKEAITHLMESYKHALAIKTLCDLCEKDQYYRSSRVDLEKMRKISQTVIEEGQSYIQANIEKLPETLAHPSPQTLCSQKKSFSLLEKIIGLFNFGS